MQNTTSASAPATWITTYGAFALSVLALLIIALAWLMRDVDQATALAVIGAILAGNGLVTATQWQAAPGVISQFQQIIGQLTSHIQTLHAQLAAQQAPQIATARLPAVQAPTPQPAPQVAQQPFPQSSPSVSMFGNQPQPVNAQTWQPSTALRQSSGG